MMLAKRLKTGIFPVFFIMTILAGALEARLQVKGLWVVRGTVTTEARVDRMIQFAISGGFTDLYVQIRGRGDAFYNSRIVPKSPLIRPAGYDPLADVIDKAHGVGIRVHVWFNAYLIWSAPDLPDDHTHLARLHPEWIDTNSDGKKDLSRLREVSRTNFEGAYLAPTNPDVNPYLLSVINELISQYQIDGLHFDYIRFQDANYGYNRGGRKQFMLEYKVDPMTLVNGKGSYWYSLKPEEKRRYWELWNNFKRQSVTNFVADAADLVRRRNPDIRLSAAVKPNYQQAYHRFFQDWKLWLDAGYLDFVVPMNYAVTMADFENNISLMREAEINFERVYMGLATYNQQPYAVIGKIYKTIAMAFPGIVIFSYDTYEQQPNYFDTILPVIRKN